MRPVERNFENDLIGREERAAVLVIEGARILDPAEGLDMTGDIVIEGKKIRGTYPAGLGREEARRAALMRTLDAVNKKFGRDCLIFGAQGLGEADWHMRQEHRSPRMTTRWDELPLVRC